jgi:hypothetical protein
MYFNFMHFVAFMSGVFIARRHGFCWSCSFSSLDLISILLSRVLVQKDARLLRDMRINAYFRQCFPSNLNITTIKELAHALASHSPYEVPVSSIKIRHLHCQVGLRC